MIALAAALYLIRPFTLPQGGSVTAGSMVPVLLFALRRGVKPGVVAGVIFGLVVLYEEPFIFHPVQVLLDYPLAFGALGLAGLLRAHPIPGVALGIGGRYIGHFLSGVVFFASFAPEGTHPALYSAIYNGGYLGVEFVVSGAVMFLLVRTHVLQLRL